MSNTLEQVLQYITAHPFCSTDSIRQNLKRPVLEVEACLGALKRQKRTVLVDGKWKIYTPKPQHQSEPELVPSRRQGPREALPDGMKRCPSCTQVLPRAEFYGNGYCKPCGRLKAKEQTRSQKRYGIRAELPRRVGKHDAIAALKRVQAAVATELAAIEST